MTDLIRRQDAINALWEDIEDCFVLHDAIKSIQGVPSAEHHKLNIAEYIHDFYPDVWKHAEKELEVPSAERKGKWLPIVKGESGYSAGDFRCSECGKSNKCYCLTDFCPNCGARMVSD